VSHHFADSTRYDLVHEGRSYPPKAVLGIAAKEVTGKDYGPYDFKGGLKSKCFKTLESNGFEIVAKAEPEPARHGEEWSDEELEASVEAYVGMLEKERLGESFFKNTYYQELADRFGRNDSSPEFRMQNISYVYVLMGRRTVTGLLPAKHVGADVARRIEKAIQKIEGISLEPISGLITTRNRTRKRTEILSKPPSVRQSTATSTASVTRFNRNQEVVEWILAGSDGICESCDKPAPFQRFDGTPYLEVHHLRRLADRGSDWITNAVALCPNCHRQFHYGDGAEELLGSIYEKLPRLIRE
jgi:5-methylcytosine-specific restriction protein A